MKKIAFLFPGQGAQSVGMGRDVYDQFDAAREVFDMAEEAARMNLSRLCFKGPMEELTQTVNLQPAVTAVNLSLLAVIEKNGLAPQITAGHSLGEYSALSACKCLSREDTIRAVVKRGQLMHRESTKYEGAMTAIVGLPIDAVEQVVDTYLDKGVVEVANHNAELQTVITGAPEWVTAAAEDASAQGARALPLKVSGAWHSSLMKGAESEFGEFLDHIDFSEAMCPVINNVTADLTIDPLLIRSAMARQLCNRVKWFESMLRMIDQQVEIFAEIGPGRVLAGLLKKTLPKSYPGKIYNIYDMKSMDKFLNDFL